jgi:hypothetical protein
MLLTNLLLDLLVNQTVYYTYQLIYEAVAVCHVSCPADLVATVRTYVLLQQTTLYAALAVHLRAVWTHKRVIEVRVADKAGGEFLKLPPVFFSGMIS